MEESCTPHGWNTKEEKKRLKRLGVEILFEETDNWDTVLPPPQDRVSLCIIKYNILFVFEVESHYVSLTVLELAL